jgi:hypothetical protein
MPPGRKLPLGAARTRKICQFLKRYTNLRGIQIRGGRVAGVRIWLPYQQLNQARTGLENDV